MDIRLVRKERLQRWIEDNFHGKVGDFASFVDEPQSVISRFFMDWDNPNHRKIGEKKARQLEDKAKMPRGWLDGSKLTHLEEDVLNILLKYRLNVIVQPKEYTVRVSNNRRYIPDFVVINNDDVVLIEARGEYVVEHPRVQAVFDEVSQLHKFIIIKPSNIDKLIPLLSEKLGVDISKRATEIDNEVDNQLAKQYQEDTLHKGVDLVESNEVPIVGTAEGGPDGHWDELGHPVGHGEEYVQAYSKDKNAYALLVSGNSMSPRMRPGEAILVEPNQEAMPGDEVIVKLKDGQVMVKLFARKQGDRYIFDSISDAHDSIMTKPEEIEFIHYVAGVFRSGSIKQRNGIVTFNNEGLFNF